MGDAVTEKKPYFWCEADEDGLTVTQMSAEDVQGRLDEEKDYKPSSRTKFAATMPKNPRSTRDWPDHLVVLIKGEIVEPKAVKTVTEYELP